jgi:hypothetical protein
MITKFEPSEQTEEKLSQQLSIFFLFILFRHLFVQKLINLIQNQTRVILEV